MVVSTSLMSPTCCHDMSRCVTMSRVPCHKSHSICQSDADCNNTQDEGETSCFNPLFVNGLSFLLTSLLSHYLSTPHVSPEIAMLFCASLSCVTLLAPPSPTERRWAVIQYCDIISVNILFPEHYSTVRVQSSLRKSASIHVCTIHHTAPHAFLNCLYLK